MNLPRKLISLILVFFALGVNANATAPDQHSIDSLLMVIDKMTARNYIAALHFIDSTLNETKDKQEFTALYLFVKIKKSSVLVKGKAQSKALQNLLEIEPDVDQHPDVSMKAFYHGITAYIYGDQGNYNMAIPFFKKALSYYQELENYEKMALTINNLATCYLAIGSLEEATDKINNALILYKEHQFDNIEGIYITAGEIKLELKDYKEALFYFNNATSATNAEPIECEINLLIARALIGLKNFPQAQAHINSCKGKNINNPGMTFAYYQTLVEYFKAINKFDSALIYNQKALKLSQTIDAQKTSEAFEIVRLNEKYELENSLLQQKIETKLFEQKLYLVIVLLSILSVGFLLYAIIAKRRDYKLLQIQNDEIATQSEELKSMTEELAAQGESLKLANEILEAKVNERTARLTAKNTQLTQYAFFNAHKLRAPIATLLGLIQLLSVSSEQEEKDKIINLIFTTTEKFDEVVKESQRIIEDYDDSDIP